MIEHRTKQRFDIALSFQVGRLGAGQKIAGEIRNLSSSGVLFTSPIPVSVGEPVEYFITFPALPGSRVQVCLHCSGRVVREETASTFAATLERHEFMRVSEQAELVSTTSRQPS
jgi:hypothetical protein